MVRPGFYDSVVGVASQRNHGWGTVLKESDATYILTSLDLLDGCSLEVQTMWSNALVAYASIELADDCALARLRTADTNLNALRWGTGATNGFLVTRPPGTNALRLTPVAMVSDSSAALPPLGDAPAIGSPFLDTQTNVLAIVAAVTRDSIELIAASPQRVWTPVRPRDFRQQLTLLVKAEQTAAGSDAGGKLAQELRSAVWATPFLRSRAHALALRLEQHHQRL